MVFKTNTKDLSECIGAVMPALPARAAIPVLDGIFLEASGGTVSMTCTDLMLQKECCIDADVSEDGAAVVPAKLFGEIVRKLPNDAVSIELADKTLQIKCGRAKSSIQCIEYDTFPEMRFDGDSQTVRVSADKLQEMIQGTAFATLQDDSRPILTGVLTEISTGDKMTLVATDAYQFAMQTAELNGGVAEDKAAIIPAKSINEIARMMNGLDVDVEVEMLFTKTHVRVDVGGDSLTARLLDGDYIDYRRILPQSYKTRVLLNRHELVESIDRAQLMTKDGSSSIRITMHDGKAVISANSAYGKVTEEVDAQISGEELEIAFNPKYCMNVLKRICGETVCMDFNGAISPCVVKPIYGESQYYLLVPVRIL